jgi:WD40 repeat protein
MLSTPTETRTACGRLALACCILSLWTGLPRPATAQDKTPAKRVWEVTPDPLAKPFSILEKTKGVLLNPTGKAGLSSIFYVTPTTPSPYLVLHGLEPGPQLWDLAASRRVAILRGLIDLGTLSPDGEFYAVNQGQSKALAWSFKTGKLVCTYQAPKGTAIEWVDFGAPGKLLLATHKTDRAGKTVSREVEIRDLTRGGELEKTFDRPKLGTTPPVYAFTPNRKYLALPIRHNDKQSSVRFYDLAEGKLAGASGRIEGAGMKFFALAISPDSEKMAAVVQTGKGSGFLATWDLKTGKTILPKRLPFDRFRIDVHGHNLHWLGDNKHVYLSPNFVVEAESARMVWDQKDIGAGGYYFLGPTAGDTQLLMWNRTQKSGDSLQLVAPKLP